MFAVSNNELTLILDSDIETLILIFEFSEVYFEIVFTKAHFFQFFTITFVWIRNLKGKIFKRIDLYQFKIILQLDCSICEFVN